MRFKGGLTRRAPMKAGAECPLSQAAKFRSGSGARIRRSRKLSVAGTCPPTAAYRQTADRQWAISQRRQRPITCLCWKAEARP